MKYLIQYNLGGFRKVVGPFTEEAVAVQRMKAIEAFEGITEVTLIHRKVQDVKSTRPSQQGVLSTRQHLHPKEEDSYDRSEEEQETSWRLLVDGISK